MNEETFSVVMPQFGMAMTEGTIVEWLKKEGDHVTEDEPLFVFETEKVSSEVSSPATGILSKIMATVGTTVPVREPVAVITLDSKYYAED